MSICRVEGCDIHYGCRLRAKGVSIAPSATPSRFRHTPRPASEVNKNSWERGIAGEVRPNGSFAPYLNEHREPIRSYEMQNRRHEVETAVRRLKSDPNVFQAERSH